MLLVDFVDKTDIRTTTVLARLKDGWSPDKIAMEYQGRPHKTNRWVIFNGERLILSEFATKIGLTRTVVTNRLNQGWTPSEIIDHYCGSGLTLNQQATHFID